MHGFFLNMEDKNINLNKAPENGSEIAVLENFAFFLRKICHQKCNRKLKLGFIGPKIVSCYPKIFVNLNCYKNKNIAV